MSYRGRIAPSPTGFLHLGHARTFWIAQERARAAGGTLVLRIEDLDYHRVRPEFVSAIYADLHWFGFSWDEGPNVGGPHAPYVQSERLNVYEAAFHKLQQSGAIYPCTCSRADVLRALDAPHESEDEPIYPGTCRPLPGTPPDLWVRMARSTGKKFCWRFRVPDGEPITFDDGHFGAQSFIAGKAFGDFVVFRHDGIPSYQLAVVADDAAMKITEVVRGADLLLSTARQILIYRALGESIPSFHHCELMRDEQGERLAKRHAALSLRAMREAGRLPDDIRREWK